MRLAARMHRRHRLALLVTEQVQALTAAGVTIRLGHHVVADEVLAGDWDGVIIAVGASDGAPHELTGHRTYSPHEVLSGTPLGRVVVVVDEDGSWRGAGLAAHLAHAGHTVELVSPHGVAGWRITMYSRPSLIQPSPRGGGGPREPDSHSMVRKQLTIADRSVVARNRFLAMMWCT